MAICQRGQRVVQRRVKLARSVIAHTSEYTFEKLKADPENIKVNFEAYLNGFSDNVMDILARMDFFTQLERMSNAGLLYQVISDFCTEKADMSPEKISAVDMGYIFENLVQRFSESYDEEAGAHFTSRDIIYLMCDLLTDRMGMAEEGRIYTVYEIKTRFLIQFNAARF